MNTIGFPNTDIYIEHEQGGEESFWPSFTDIMMVIVMTFLLITVAVILNNWELVNNLKASIDAEKQATAKAQSALQAVETKARENETLEERVARLEKLLATRTLDLKNSRKVSQETLAVLNTTRDKLKQTQTTYQQLQQEKHNLMDTLATRQQTIEENTAQIDLLKQQQENLAASAEETKARLEKQIAQSQSELSVLASAQEKAENLESELESKQKELEELRQKDTEGHEKLLSLQGEYEQLDKKYQKLLRPARSEKNKHVVRVVLKKANGNVSYQLGDMGKSLVNIYSRRKLDQKLKTLKQTHGDDLYVKIIIPESSRVSHAEAWKFTSDILNKFDYYYSENKQEP